MTGTELLSGEHDKQRPLTCELCGREIQPKHTARVIVSQVNTVGGYSEWFCCGNCARDIHKLVDMYRFKKGR